VDTRAGRGGGRTEGTKRKQRKGNTGERRRVKKTKKSKALSEVGYEGEEKNLRKDNVPKNYGGRKRKEAPNIKTRGSGGREEL